MTGQSPAAEKEILIARAALIKSAPRGRSTGRRKLGPEIGETAFGPSPPKKIDQLDQCDLSHFLFTFPTSNYSAIFFCRLKNTKKTAEKKSDQSGRTNFPRKNLAEFSAARAGGVFDGAPPPDRRVQRGKISSGNSNSG